MKTIKAIAAVIMALLVSVSGTVIAFAMPVETVVTAENGAICTLENGDKIRIPKGETVIITGTYDGTGIRYKNYEGTVDSSALKDEGINGGEAIKLKTPKKYFITAKDGVPIYSKPSDGSHIIGKMPYGTTFSSSYYIETDFWGYVYVDYKGRNGWVYIQSCYETAEYPDPSASREIITAKEGLRLTEKTKSGDIKECSEPIPYGTKLKYEYCRNEYYEGGYTSYYTEYKGVKGWLLGAHFTYDTFPYYNTTLDEHGYYIITPDDNVTFSEMPFGKGAKLNMSIPENTLLEYESSVGKVVYKDTGRELAKSNRDNTYSYDFDYYDREKTVDEISSIKVEYDGRECWITYSGRRDVVASSEQPSAYYSFKNVNVYGNIDCKGEKLFTIPALNFGKKYLQYYDYSSNQMSYYVEYNGKYGWVSDGNYADDFYIYTAFEDISIYSSINGDKTVKTIPPGSDFTILEQYFSDDEDTNGRIIVSFKGEVGWIDKESDYLYAGLYDWSKQIDASTVTEYTGTEEAEESGTDPAIAESDAKNEHGKLIITAVVIAAVLLAAALIVVVIVINKKRKEPKS